MFIALGVVVYRRRQTNAAHRSAVASRIGPTVINSDEFDTLVEQTSTDDVEMGNVASGLVAAEDKDRTNNKNTDSGSNSSGCSDERYWYRW